MSGPRRRRTFSYLLASRRPLPLTLIERSLASVWSTAFCRSALTMPSRLTVKTTETGVTHGARNSHALLAGAPHSFLTCTTTVSWLPSFWIVRSASPPALP